MDQPSIAWTRLEDTACPRGRATQFPAQDTKPRAGSGATNAVTLYRATIEALDENRMLESPSPSRPSVAPQNRAAEQRKDLNTIITLNPDALNRDPALDV